MLLMRRCTRFGWQRRHGSTLSKEQKLIAKKRQELIEKDHLALKTEYPKISQDDETELTTDLINRKRMIYRSKQRGWLEVDLLLGSFAAKHVMGFSTEELKEYEEILNQETIDIFNYISGKDPIPDHLQTSMMKTLQNYCNSSPLGHASISGFTRNKKYMSN